jgi:ferredoxin
VNDLSTTPTPITPAECGRCGAGEDVCARCDRELDLLETLVGCALRHVLRAEDAVLSLRGMGVRCGQLGHLVEVEGLGAMRCTRTSPRRAEWVLTRAPGVIVEGEALVALLADAAWEARHVG